jgi:hypothetical protein
MSDRNMPERKRRKSGQERTAEYRKNNPDKVKITREKEKLDNLVKRVEDEKFDDEVKRKERERKRVYRAKKTLENKENENKENEESTSKDDHNKETTNESPATSNQTPKSRQSLAGLLARRRTNKEKNETIDDLMETNKDLEHENARMDISVRESETENMKLKIENKKKDKEISDLKNKLVENDLWLKSTYKYMTSSGKLEFKTAHKLASNEHIKGTNYRLRQNTGINLDKKMAVTSEEESELKKQIDEFAKENSSESPDMRNERKGIRYRHKYLSCLYDDFKHENPEVDVALSVFCSYWPKNVLKPKPGDYALCTCEKCENPALKVRALKRHKLIKQEHELETILRDIREEKFDSEEALKDDLKALMEEPKASEQVTFLEWSKVQKAELNKNTGVQKRAVTQRVPNVTIAKDLAVKTLADLQVLKEHLERNHMIKQKVLEKREEAKESDDKVMLQVDWAENGTIITPDEVQSTFFGGRITYSIHTGYQYSKRKSGGFVSLSDENDHKAEAIHVAMDTKIKELADEGFKEITIVSDSPTSQYRNGKSAYLTSKWAVEHKVKICWLFTEAGHGKSAADGIGGNIKNKTQEKQNMEPDLVIKSAVDVMENIETSIEMKVHTKEDIEKVRETMPPKVGALVGATKIHELVFETNGKIKKKNLPNEAFYKPVTIKVGTTVTRTLRVDLNIGFIEQANEENDNMVQTNEEEEVDIEAEDRRKRMRLRRRLATVDDIFAELEDEFQPEYDSDDE